MCLRFLYVWFNWQKYFFLFKLIALSLTCFLQCITLSFNFPCLPFENVDSPFILCGCFALCIAFCSNLSSTLPVNKAGWNEILQFVSIKEKENALLHVRQFPDVATLCWFLFSQSLLHQQDSILSKTIIDSKGMDKWTWNKIKNYPSHIIIFAMRISIPNCNNQVFWWNLQHIHLNFYLLRKSIFKI